MIGKNTPEVPEAPNWTQSEDIKMTYKLKPIGHQDTPIKNGLYTYEINLPFNWIKPQEKAP